MIASPQNSEGILHLYAGMADYDSSGTLRPPCTLGTNTIPPANPEEVIRSRLLDGQTPESIAWNHAKYSMGWSPGISFTTKREVAEDFALKKSKEGKNPYVVETALPPTQVISIFELSQRHSHHPDGLSLEQVEFEQEQVYLGGMREPTDKYIPVTITNAYIVPASQPE